MMEKEFIEIIGCKCYKGSFNGDPSFEGVIDGKISVTYIPPFLTHFRFNHTIFIYREVNLAYGRGDSLEDALKNLSESLKGTIDNINLIKGRIL